MTVDSQTVTEGIALTEGAAGKVKDLIANEDAESLALRISVAPGGCSGLRYQLQLDDRQLEGSLPDRCDHRLRRHHRAAGLHDRQPERTGLLRLRR